MLALQRKLVLVSQQILCKGVLKGFMHIFGFAPRRVVSTTLELDILDNIKNPFYGPSYIDKSCNHVRDSSVRLSACESVT